MVPVHPDVFSTGMVLSAVFSTALGADSIPTSDDYASRVREAEDGPPHNNFSGIARTPDGHLWITMWWGGLARFDGVRFTSFSKKTTPGLEPDRAQPVFAARDGALWPGLGRGGAARRHGDSFESVAPLALSAKAALPTRSFAGDAKGAVWFGYGPGAATFVHADTEGRGWVRARTFSCDFSPRPPDPFPPSAFTPSHP